MAGGWGGSKSKHLSRSRVAPLYPRQPVSKRDRRTLTGACGARLGGTRCEERSRCIRFQIDEQRLEHEEHGGLTGCC